MAVGPEVKLLELAMNGGLLLLVLPETPVRVTGNDGPGLEVDKLL